MKRIILILVSVCILSKTADAQIDLKKYSQTYLEGTTGKASNFGIITAVPMDNNAFWGASPNQTLNFALKKDTAFYRNRPNDFVAITTFDTAKAQFFLHGVTRRNGNKYELRVMSGQNKILVPWRTVTNFTDARFAATTGWPQMAYLGGYKAGIGDKIIIDIRKKGSERIIATSVVAWKYVKPFLTDVYTANELNLFLTRVARSWSLGRPGEQQSKWAKHNKNGPLSGLFVLEPSENNLIFYFNGDISSRKQLEYELIKNNEVLIHWKTNDFDNGFVWLKTLSPAAYTLKVRYSAQREHVTECLFEIKSRWDQTFGAKVIFGILVCASLGFIVFLILNIKQRRWAADELSKKTRLQLELKAIRAQLNPHFIFNALSSIQGLVNKQDIKGANKYLADFAKLMRNSLNNSNKESTSIDQEIFTLETYLKLEQLRFGFQYAFSVDKNINIYETEIPSLVLQPLVENAAKHGVSALQENGKIIIDFLRRGNDMIVTIDDNGSGYGANITSAGLGLKLTQDRIKLLNELTNERFIDFQIDKASPKGTQVRVTFKNWFL
ncbi:MAG: sensor histidine kinase [Sphingobacteriales bacterium]